MPATPTNSTPESGCASGLVALGSSEAHANPFEHSGHLERTAGVAFNECAALDAVNVIFEESVIPSIPTDLIGLTVTRDCPARAFKGVVKAIPDAAANSNLYVLVGGLMIDKKPGLTDETGVDESARDARAALELVQQIVPTAPAMTRALS